MPDRETVVAYQVAQVSRAYAKHQRRLEEAIEHKESGWHRIAVQVKQGEVKNIQIIVDENIVVVPDQHCDLDTDTVSS